MLDNIESIHKLEGEFVPAPIKFVPRKSEPWNFFVMERPRFLMKDWIFNYRDTMFSRKEYSYHEKLLSSKGGNDQAIDDYVSMMFRAMRPSKIQKFIMRMKERVTTAYQKMRY